MAPHRIITHAYRLPGGWQKRTRETLTPETAEALQRDGYTLLRTKRPWHRASELSIAQYLRSHQR